MKSLRCVFLLLVFCVGLIFTIVHRPIIETDILKSVVKQNNQLLLDINKHSNSDVIVIFKDDSKEEFLKVVKNEKLGEIVSQDDIEYQKIIQVYPKSFLLGSTKKLIKQKQYKQLEINSMQLLYSPLDVPIVSVDKDPYLFVTDYFMINFSAPEHPIVKIKANNVGAIVDLSKKYDVYLAGTPVHSYKTAQKSALQINIFGILATVFVLLICKYMFGSYRIFVPVIASILFGLGTGYIITSLVYRTIHILTFVFATTLIGVGVDYSLHYYANEVHNKEFYKNLTSSMLTTIIAFAFLMIPDIPLLNQMSLYTIGGLVGVYSFVTCVFPMLPFNVKSLATVKLPKFNKKWFTILGLTIILLGILQVKTDDSIKNLYNPDKSLKEAETIYQHSTNPQNKEISFIITKDEGFVCDILKRNNVEYISESKFVPSISEQKENIKLINDLYRTNNYPDFLTKEQRNNLTKENNAVFKYNIPSFHLDKDRRIIIAYGLNLQNIPNAEVVNIQKDISLSLKQSRRLTEPLIPILFLGMFLYLYIMYSKQALKIIIPPFVGVCMSVALGQLFGYNINIFSILTIFLIIGFTIDYSIFKSSGKNSANIAVFSACISTAFSFLLLSFTGFKLISCFGVLLFVGVVSSYITSCMIFDEDVSPKQWFEVKERSVGVKRLKLSFYIYKMFGRKPLEWIAWWVGLITYLVSPNLRRCSNKYFQVLYEYTKDKKYKPSFVNNFRHVYAYALSLVDKMEVYSGKAKFGFKITKQLESDLKKGGLFFIFTHVGNVEVMRAFIQNKEHKKVNIFMQKKHCETFNNFINSLSDNKDVKIFPVEDIGIETVIELKERLNNNEIVFMAGDRLSSSNTNKCYNTKFLGQDLKLPLGSLKFALMLEVPIYLISCIKLGNGFVVESQKIDTNNNKNDNLIMLQKEFSKFLEKTTLIAPYQFYHFYDLFR